MKTTREEGWDMASRFIGLEWEKEHSSRERPRMPKYTASY